MRHFKISEKPKEHGVLETRRSQSSKGDDLSPRSPNNTVIKRSQHTLISGLLFLFYRLSSLRFPLVMETTATTSAATVSEQFIRLLTKLKRATLLWLEGFREACCLHRVVIVSLRSKKLLIRTGQCFLLNGFIFLGSIFALNSVVIPILEWILPVQCSKLSSQEPCSLESVVKLYSFFRHGLLQLFYVFWFYPLYIFSFILSALWYNDIAKYGFAATPKSGLDVSETLGQNEVTTSVNTPHMEKPAGIGGVMIGIGEQVYSILLLNFFFLEVYATGFIPVIGKAINFILLSWMYAYYCFEYKWNLSEVSLDRRLDFFESNWAYFAGFGSPCVLAIFFFSPLVSYGVMAVLFPLFVLTATGSKFERLILSERGKWKCKGLGRCPIFYAADATSMRILSLLPLESKEQLHENKTQ